MSPAKRSDGAGRRTGATPGRGSGKGPGAGRGGKGSRRNPIGENSASGSGKGTSGRGAGVGRRSGTQKAAPADAGGVGRAGFGRGTERSGTAPGRPPAKRRGLGGEQVEGRQAVRELLLAGNRRIREVLVADDHDDTGVLQDLVDLCGDLRVTVRLVSRSRLAGLARTESPQGVVALAAALPEHELDDLATVVPGKPVPFLLAVDGVTDPGNLGALLRTAECAGVTGVVLPRHRAVHVTPTVAKAAAGAVEHLPMALVGGLPTAITQLRDRGVWVVGLDAGGDVSLFDLPVADEPVCLVLGAEGTGLSRLVRQRCDVVASIPLQGAVGSLNVAVAGALACFEVVRRRLAAAEGG